MAGALVPHLKGHILLFEGRPSPALDSRAGLRLLLIFVLLEAVIGPRFSLLSLLRLPIPPAWVRVPILLVLCLLMVRFFAGVKLSQIGLYRWREWTTTEKSYFIQVFLIANVIFSILFASRLKMIFADPSLRGGAVVVAVTYLLWGFYQEVVYRGILQSELVRRWGTWPGILVSNLLYTFGPLHFYHFSAPSNPLPMFLAIFAIGLFFGVLFRRSGNLWMVGIFHGLGDSYITGLGTFVSSNSVIGVK